MPKPRSKYNAKGVWIDDIFFASQAEGTRYTQLKQLEKLKQIDRLDCQVTYQLSIKGVHICNYRADFRYFVIDERGYSLRMVVEDVKGMILPEYTLKKRLMLGIHGINVIEIPAKQIDKWMLRIP